MIRWILTNPPGQLDQMSHHRKLQQTAITITFLCRVKKVEHNYSKKIKKQFKRSIERVGREQLLLGQTQQGEDVDMRRY